MRADGQVRRPVVREHPLPLRLLGQRRHLRGRIERQRELLGLAASAGHALRTRDESELPQQRPPGLAEAVAGARLDERLEAGRGRLLGGVRWASSRRVAYGRPAATASASFSPTPRTYPTPTRTAPSSMEHCASLAFTSGGSTTHAAALAVADEAGRRIEAHRLRVQERAQELGRVVVAEPRRLVGEQRERGGVRLGEAEAREADELVVDPVGGLVVDAVRERALDEPRTMALQRLQAPLAAHRAPQPLGLADGEPGQRHRHLEHLVLEDDDAERLAQRLVRAADGRRAGRRPGPRAASAAVRCTGGRRRPGSARAGRARPARSGRRGSPAACAAGSASARGSRSGSRRRCPRPGSRRRPPGRRAGCATGRRPRRARGRCGRRSPRPRRACPGRAGRSS